MLSETNNFQHKPADSTHGTTGKERIVEWTPGVVTKQIKQAMADKAHEKVEKAQIPDRYSEQFERNCEKISLTMEKDADLLFTSVRADEKLREKINAYESGQLRKKVDPKFEQFVRLYRRIQRFLNMCRNPEKYHKRSGYPYGRVNLLATIDVNEGVQKPNRHYPEGLLSSMRSRIEEEAAELKEVMTVQKVKPPHPQIEKRGRIINNLPAGMNNPDAQKNAKKVGDTNPNGAGRPSEVDSDVHTTSWDREKLVNKHMSKADKAEREFQKGVAK